MPCTLRFYLAVCLLIHFSHADLLSLRRVTPDLLQMFMTWNPEAAAVREDGQVSFQADNLREETARAPLHSLCSNPAVVDISLLRIVLEACPQVCLPPKLPASLQNTHRPCHSARYNALIHHRRLGGARCAQGTR